MDFLIDKIFKAIIHTVCTTSFIEIVGGKIKDPASLFTGLIMNHLFQSAFQVLTNNYLGVLIS